MRKKTYKQLLIGQMKIDFLNEIRKNVAILGDKYKNTPTAYEVMSCMCSNCNLTINIPYFELSKLFDKIEEDLKTK